MNQDRRESFRRKDDKMFLPTEEQERQIDHIMAMSEHERERFQILMHLDTRDILFAHMDREEKKIEDMYKSYIGDKEAGVIGLKDSFESFQRTEQRLNTWLDGACFVLKTVLPWALGIAASIVGLGVHLKWF